jgi:hypothetical protein
LAALEAVSETAGAPELNSVVGVGVPGVDPKILDVGLTGGKLGDEDGGTNEKALPLLLGVPNPLNELNLLGGGVPGF